MDSKPKGGIGLQEMSDANRNVVLGIIHEEKGISRTELAQKTGLSLSAISRIIKQLLEDGLVIETGEGNSNGGRRPITVRLNPTAVYAIGVDFGKTKANAGVFDLSGNLVYRYEAAVHDKDYLAALFEAIDRCIETLQDPSKLAIIYCGVRGFLDNANGVILQSATFGWSNIPLRQILMDRYSVTVGMDINARLAALGEWKKLYSEVDDLVYITTSWGICAGVISRRHIFRGGWGVAGEIGNTISFLGDGQRNLEECCGGQMLVRRAREEWNDEQNRLLRRLTGDNAEGLTVEYIISAAKVSDPFALRILEEAAEVLARGVVNVVYTYNPSQIVIGGLLSEIGDALLVPLRAKLKALLPALLYDQIRVSISVLGSSASLFGAAEAAYQYLFSAPVVAGTARENIMPYGE